jgi:DNA topoisomerase-1
MTLRHGRFGAFLGCSKYPDCKGIVNIPKKGDIVYDPRDLPPCPALTCDGHITARKSRFGKTFFSCSNYPDCDVIASSLEQLPTKYINHPKTPYVKKAKRGRFGKKEAAEPKSTAKKAKKTTTRTQPGYTVSPELAAIIGTTTASRPEATKLLWDYIKAHKLQDPKDKRVIRPDKALAKVLGKDPINMMKLASSLTQHLKK